MKIYLASACLMGLKSRYDGQIMASAACRKAVRDGICIPVCPEQLGGLPTPRPPADLAGGDGRAVIAGRARVVDKNGLDVTENFLRGAEQVLEIARQHDIARVFLKAGSPSCGLAPIMGVTAAMLLAAGYTVVETG
jgi:uncharacterized protein YbbK (DUF523 family)